MKTVPASSRHCGDKLRVEIIEGLETGNRDQAQIALHYELIGVDIPSSLCNLPRFLHPHSLHSLYVEAVVRAKDTPNGDVQNGKPRFSIINIRTVSVTAEGAWIEIIIHNLSIKLIIQ